MHSDFKDNRRKIQKALFDTGFWKTLQDATLILEETKEKAELTKIEITNIPLSKDIDMAYLIDLELNMPILGRTEQAKTMEKALLLITDPMVSIFMFELKSSLQADDENDISGIHNKLKDTIARMSVLLTTFVFGDNFKETEIQYKGIVFYNRDNNLINEASSILKRKELYKVFDGKKHRIKIEHDISGIHEVEVYFCKNPTYRVSPNTFSIDFSTFIEEWEADLFKNSNISLPQLLG